jgi:hypothetical protein
MTAQSIQNTSQINQSSGLHSAKAASAVQTASQGTSSTWRKFSCDTTTTFNGEVDVNASMDTFYMQMEHAWDKGNFEEALKGLDVILEKHLPAANGLIRAFLLVAKSKCHEELGQIDEALEATKEALLAVEQHKTTIEALLEMIGSETLINARQFLELRKAGLMLLKGQEDEAFEVLRANQPTQVSGALLYHLLEKRSGQPLLESQPTEKEDLKSLFMAGRYEEIIQKTEDLPEKAVFFPWNSRNNEYQLRAAALAVTGRGDEALNIEHQWTNEWRAPESENIYQLIRALKGEEVNTRDPFNYEIETGVPVSLFLKWISRS